MNKNKWLIPMLLAGMLSMGLQCEKDPPLNPDDGLTELEKLDKYAPISTEGKNIFGMMINGKAWLPKGDHLFPPLGAGYGKSTQDISIDAKYIDEDEDIFEDFIMTLKPAIINQADTFILNRDTLKLSWVNFATGPLEIGKRIYYLSVNDGGKCYLTRFDTAASILSGQFEFIAINEADLNDSFKVTNGRFDITYAQ